MLDPALDVYDDLVGIAFEPTPIELFRDRPELDDEVVREVLGFDLAALLTPEPDECRSSSPMMIRASEPPMKERRSVHWTEFCWSPAIC